MLVSRRERRADWPQPRGGFGSARVLGQSTRHMLSIAPVTAPGGTKPTPRRSKNHGLRLGNGRFPYGAWIVVAVVVLLFPLDASANLAAEVPLSHWSYEALARLEAAGIVDPLSVASPGRASPIDRPLTRFELASAAREALMFALTLVTGERHESLEPHRTLLGVATALEHRLGRASAFYQELLKLARGEAGMPRDASLAGGLERFSGDLQALETEARQIWSEIAPLLKSEDAADVVKGAAERIDALRERLEKALAELTDQLGEHLDAQEMETMQRLLAPEFTAVVESYLDFSQEWLASDSRFVKKLTAPQLVEDLRALAEEFAADIERIDPDSQLGALMDVLRLGEDLGALLADQRGEAWRGERRRRVNLDAIIAALESGAPARQRSLPLALELLPAESDPGARVAKAEYGFRILGVDLLTSLSMDAGETGEPSIPTTRVQASLPLAGQRGGLEAGYSFVDVDRLRELSSDPAAQRRRTLGGLLYDQDGQSRLHVAGELPLGGAASIRVGYELRLSDETVRNDAHGRVGSVLGAGLNYRLGESASLSASFSMINFEGAQEAAKSGVGEAELVIQF